MRALLKFATAIDGIGRLCRGAEWLGSLVPHGPAHRPISDPRGVRNAVQADLGSSSRVEYGYIVDAIPGIREYRVMPEGGGPLMECTALMHGTSGATGVYDGSTFGVGCHVRYIRHRQAPLSGTIIGAEPCHHYDPRLMYSDIVSQGSNTGIHIETGFQSLLKMAGAIGSIVLNGGFVNYGGRTPWDSCEIGELNWSTETGLMLHMDPAMTFLRADEMTGIWFFYWDGLTRIAGQQLQEITSISTREVYDDEGEGSSYHGVTPYPWEGRGMLLNPNDTLTTENTADVTQFGKPYYARIEPKNDDQQAFHRFQTYGGYLGQHEKKTVSIPTTTSGGGSVNVGRYSTRYNAQGLYDQQITMAGHMFMRSALGITIAKRPIIPIPKRMKVVADATGDGAGNYKAAGLYTDGKSVTDHKVQPTPTRPTVGVGEELPYSACAVTDLHAHMFNWEGLHPFYYHQKDYYIPEESGFGFISTNQEIPYWSQLDSQTQWYLSPATKTSTKIDHRTGDKVDIYNNTSYVTLLDDGGVLIGGGCGEEIRMVGGSIFLTAPGDVFTEAGRNIIGWAGRDHCIRAWGSVDITANTKDVRLKAEHNMQLLSANDKGIWGTFIECRSNGPAQYDFTAQGENVKHAGIILQAKGTELCGYAQSIYLRSCLRNIAGTYTGYSGAHSIAKPGDITLDAEGCGDITTRSSSIKHWVRCAIVHAFEPGAAATSAVAANMFTPTGTLLTKSLRVDDTIVGSKDIVSKGNVVATAGAFFSDKACAIQKIPSASSSSISSVADEVHTKATALLTWVDAQYVIDFTNMWYAIGRPGNDNTIQSEWVSLRVDADYKAQSFTLYESRWAQLSRVTSSSSQTKWTENSVWTNVSGLMSYPFPGKQALVTASNTYKQHSYKLHDPGTQKAKDRGSVYESPLTLNTPSYVKLDGNYPIIGKS